MKSIKQLEKFLSDNMSFLKNKSNLEVNGLNKIIPSIYLTPKLQENLTKARCIIATIECSVKPLSKAVMAALKLIYMQIEN